MKTKLAGKKILFGCVPVDGHFNPLTGLAKYLQEEGCDVRWYVSGIYADKLKKMDIAQYTYEKALDINSKNLHQLIPGLDTNDPLKKNTLYLEHLFTGRAEEYYEDIKQIHQSFPFDLMICDSMFTAIPFVRYDLKIPVMAIGITPLPEDSVDVAPGKAGLPPAKDDETREVYAGLYRQVMIDYKEPIAAFSAVLRKYGIPFTELYYLNILIRSANLYLQIGTPDLEYKRSDLGSNIRFIGGLMPYSKPNTKEKWFDERLDRYKKIVLVTQGTIENDITKLLEPTLDAFKDTDVLVIATTGGNGTAVLSNKYAADNVIIADFLPYEDVMPHASVYVTNGGYGGAMLSLKHKLPMVTAGLNEGKIEICARIGYFKYGIDLKTETPAAKAIYDAATEIMENEIYKINVSRISDELSGYHSNELCADYAMELMEEYKPA